MALAADLEALRATKPRTFDQWLDIADDHEKNLVTEAIADVTLPANGLADALRKNGIPITRDRIIRWREEGQ